MRRPSHRELFFLALALAALMVATLLAALPGSPAAPVDALSGAPLTGVLLRPSPGTCWLLPFALPSDLIAGAPAPPWAALSLLLWGAGLAKGSAFLRRKRAGAAFRDAFLAAARAGGLSLVAGLALIAFALLLPLPSWTLVKRAPDLVAADLQAHTFASHDGLATAEQNLRWHADRGFDLVAFTEHGSPLGAFAALGVAGELDERDGRLPAALPGVEVNLRGLGYVCAIGMGDPLTGTGEMQWPRDPALFLPLARARGAAVVALADGLSPEGVSRMAGAGVDGFEVANLGHSLDPQAVRQRVREEVRAQGLVPVAWSDWHGWGGACRTWTLFRIPLVERMPKDEMAAEVVRIIRGKRAGQVTAVTSGEFGPAPWWRVAAAPVIEPLRYCRELTPGKLAALWAWAALAFLLWIAAGRSGRGGLLLLGGGYLAVVACGLLWRSSQLFLLGGPHAFPREVAAGALLLGLAAGGVAVLTVLKGWSKR
jgi:hypothetical protein